MASRLDGATGGHMGPTKLSTPLSFVIKATVTPIAASQRCGHRDAANLHAARLTKEKQENVAFPNRGRYSHAHERVGALRTHRHDQVDYLDVDYRHRDYSLACRAGCSLTD